ncbi:hypothetical protein BD410DRAFT_796628 [Rickenella mellea]|uniref:Peptidase C51 domain-containing protein n=1 Tax=Rickenella mellea TaxID=50990 RepID=A0A4Y7PIG8_9AGAM|nr:hypothetical protein BD410DRAFT_796628 [Rickenella mellea]
MNILPGSCQVLLAGVAFLKLLNTTNVPTGSKARFYTWCSPHTNPLVNTESQRWPSARKGIPVHSTFGLPSIVGYHNGTNFGHTSVSIISTEFVVTSARKGYKMNANGVGSSVLYQRGL